MKKDIDKRFIKKIAKTFSNVDANLIKEAMEENIDNAPNSFFLDPNSRKYPIGTPAQAYVSYLGAVCCGDNNSANKIASILQDIYNIDLPQKAKSIKQKVQIKTAGDYIKFLPREEKYKVKLAHLSDSHVSREKAGEQVNLRIEFYKMNHDNPDNNVIKAYTKIANIISEYEKLDKKMTREELAKIATAVEAIDRSIGADRYYGRYINDPIDFVNSIVTKKERIVKLGSIEISKDNSNVLRREYFENIIPHQVMDYIFKSDGTLDFEKFASFVEAADNRTIEKIKKVIGLLNLL
ncbi:MAG: hypothetical protein ABIM30_00080 [candidate division WOR-3 bacterium]